ncbi:MAG TPA: hypothetical protein VHF51_19525 [Solirubrobacteraceae bacterium]|nr:hypothetical protein [Solirubrobacteraceae bacterium]
MAGTARAGATSAQSGGDGGVKEQAQDKAQEVREKAGEQVRSATGQARDRVRSQVDERSTQMGQQVRTQAGDMRTVADQLREQGKDGPARMVEQVADRAERAGSWLTDSDADRILSDVEDFARRNPWALAAGALALGFSASRVLKASSSRRYEQRSTAGELPRAGRTTAGRAGHTPTDPLVQSPTPQTTATPTPAEGERFATPGGGL